MKTKKELKIEYMEFIDNIPYYLRKIKQLMDLKEITYSFDEIDKVKDFYTSNYKNPDNLGISYDELVNLFYAYVGEAFKHYCNGNWEISLMKSDEAYGTPIILNWGNDREPHGRISLWVWKTLIERGQFRETISEKIRVAMKNN